MLGPGRDHTSLVYTEVHQTKWTMASIKPEEANEHLISSDNSAITEKSQNAISMYLNTVINKQFVDIHEIMALS